MHFDAFFDIAREVLIDHRVCATGFERGDDFGDHPAFDLRSLDDCDGAVVLFDYDFHALADFFQHGMEIAGELGFGDMCRHILDDSEARSTGPDADKRRAVNNREALETTVCATCTGGGPLGQ